ncbi:helix-turn-helix domain-containing protein [Kitasatospora sp. NBC_00039]|uniref:helix-turn-helix domain-containing protein n=1 Tax=Kitasatospora sp. NBC_00039 TaxID=2903565 RepID=UPI00324CDA07
MFTLTEAEACGSAPEALVSVSTDGVVPPDRLEWWSCLMETDVMPVALTSDHEGGFRGSARAVDLPGARVAEFAFSPMSARRGPAQIRRFDPEQYHLFLVQGSPIQLEQSRNVASLTTGSLAVFDTSRPLAADFFTRDDRGHRVTLMQLPRTAVPLKADRMERLLGRSLAVRSPAGVLLGHFLSGLLESAGHGGPAELRRTGAIGVQLAAAYFAGLLDARDALPVETREQVLLARVDTFIEHNLGDPELCPAVIAAHHHISLRTLHQLFRTRPETVAATIRRRRLERSRVDLVDPRLRHCTIGDVAARWGFRAHADFSRAFRAAYGVAPSDVRGPDPQGRGVEGVSRRGGG